MLVVPYFWDESPILPGSAFAARLRDWADEGIEMFLHGYRHRDDCRHSRWIDRLQANGMTAGEGEFLGLTAGEARQRIADGRSLIEDVTGKAISGFVAPAWLYGPGALAALSDTGVAIVEDHWRVWNPASDQTLARSPGITWATRTRVRMASSLAVAGLAKRYKSRQVVKELSLEVSSGEVVGLLGPNGAGKTTAFYMITGLIKADKGRIELDGYDVTNLPMYQRARLGIGYLPQEASIFRGLSVEDNIRAVLEVAEPDRRKREYELDSLLEEFNIVRLRKSPSIALSGGERRRVEIARALATKPNYMLLDEPFAGIDPIAVGDIQQLVRHLTNRGIGVLITDHNVRETLGLTDRAYIVYAGQVLTEGHPEDIVNDREVRRLYLGEEFRL